MTETEEDMDVKTVIPYIVLIACVITCGYLITQNTQNETVLDYNYTERCHNTTQVITHEIEYRLSDEDESYCRKEYINCTSAYPSIFLEVCDRIHRECKKTKEKIPRIKTINTTVCTGWILVKSTK